MLTRFRSPALLAPGLALAVVLGGALAACGSDGPDVTRKPPTAPTVPKHPTTTTTAPHPTTTVARRTPRTVASPPTVPPVTAPLSTPPTTVPPTTRRTDIVNAPHEPVPGYTAFCAAYGRLNTVGEGLDPSTVAGFRQGYGQMRSAVEQLASVAPTDLRGEVALLQGWLREMQPKVDALRTPDQIDALARESTSNGLEAAADRIQQRAEDVCGPAPQPGGRMGTD